MADDPRFARSPIRRRARVGELPAPRGAPEISTARAGALAAYHSLWLGTFGVISGTPIAVAEEEFGARNKEKSRRGVGTSKFFRPTERRKFQNFASIAEANFNTRVLCHQRRICPGLLHESHTSLPANRHVTDIVGPCDCGQRLALGHPRQCFRLLMLSEFRPTITLHCYSACGEWRI